MSISKVSRVAYNSSGWQHPTGEARALETNTYAALNGFAHEEWLFRSEWLIDGWRYTFIQGVNQSREKLLREGQPIDICLFTKEPDKRRRFVAVIRNIECLDNRQAEQAVAELKRRGWFETMRNEIKAIGGNLDAFGSGHYAPHIVNVRFRQADVTFFSRDSYVPDDHPIQELDRYQLNTIGEEHFAEVSNALWRGSTDLPDPQSFQRGAIAPVDCTPEHAMMQRKLMELLRKDYPNGQIRREADFVDVSVRLPDKLILFEIKSDLEPKSVIRHALGQILEYAYHPSRSHDLPLELVIVGRKQPTYEDAQYLWFLKKTFNLPVGYRAVSI